MALCCYRTLAAQGAAGHLLAAGAALFASTPALNWLLIFRLGLGLDGSALAAVACETVYVAALLAACWLHNAARPPERRWWGGWSCAALASGWGRFLRLSLAATLMITLDWCAAGRCWALLPCCCHVAGPALLPDAAQLAGACSAAPGCRPAAHQACCTLHPTPPFNRPPFKPRWVYDLLTLLAGRLPHPEVPLAASGLLYYIQARGTVLVFMCTFVFHIDMVWRARAPACRLR